MIIIVKLPVQTARFPGDRMSFVFVNVLYKESQRSSYLLQVAFYIK